MNSNETKYYLILNETVGKEENGWYYLFIDGKWIPDEKCVIMDRLVGYDSSEPDGSPYGMYEQSIMDEIEEITYERAMELIGG